MDGRTDGRAPCLRSMVEIARSLTYGFEEFGRAKSAHWSTNTHNITGLFPDKYADALTSTRLREYCAACKLMLTNIF